MGTRLSISTCLAIAMATAVASCASNPGRQAGLVAVQDAVTDLGQGDALPAEVHWSYAGENGPSSWGTLAPAFAACAEGRAQSPINFMARSPQPLTPIVFDYRPTPLDIQHNGHTIQLTNEAGSSILLDGQRYEMNQLHFHAPSEHTVEGEHYPLEMHLVHRDRAGRLAVVGVLFELGAENPSLAQVWNHLPPEPGAPVRVEDGTVDAMDILPSTDSFYRYRGSLTTPPCTEQVRWAVLRTPVQLSDGQLSAFTSIVDHNNRPVQPLYDRTVRTRAGTP